VGPQSVNNMRLLQAHVIHEKEEVLFVFLSYQASVINKIS
jgi:hypothetical protein